MSYHDTKSGSVAATRTADLAERGMRVRTSQGVELGSRLEFEIEVIMPTKVCLGFEVDSLIIDGPSVSHFARLPGVVRRCEPTPDGHFDIGVEFVKTGDPETERVVDLYLEHLRDGVGSHYL